MPWASTSWRRDFYRLPCLTPAIQTNMIASVFKCLLRFSTVLTRLSFRSGILLLVGLKELCPKSLRHLLHMKTPKAAKENLLKSSSFINNCFRKADFFYQKKKNRLLTQRKISKKIYFEGKLFLQTWRAGEVLQIPADIWKLF